MTMSPTTPIPTADVQQRLQRCSLLADTYSLEVIESECVAEQRAGVKWLDTRPMLSADERGGESVDIMAVALQHAIDRRLVFVHPDQVHLVRLAQAS
jgi:hypothetical protein